MSSMVELSPPRERCVFCKISMHMIGVGCHRHITPEERVKLEADLVAASAAGRRPFSLNREWGALDEPATGSWPHRAKAVGLAPHEIDACECSWIGVHAEHAAHVRVMVELDEERVRAQGDRR